ncbi:hypothetical protein AGDE_14785 [Angomonas deanei]|nr:hypothetical protein AGDE_14785 [Angomonas deanei]|eukprot:EPY20229.1 hypothetical protein AGDE_14785 [Angomonas deanei]
MGAASKCIETLERDINDLAAKSLSTTAYRTFKIACGQVLIEYATFFNLFLAFQSALSGELGSFVDSLSPYNSSYLGFTRFPSLSRTCTAQKEETDVGELQGLNPCNEVSYNYFRLFGMKENEFVFPSATGRSLSCIPKIVSAVLMPSDSFAALHIIAAIASKPLQEALFLIRSLPELQTLYASSPLMAPLLSAVEKGDFKKALQAGNEIQSQLLAKEYFLGEEFVTNLMERFKCSVCFSFFVVYENIPIAKGCEALGLSEAEVLTIVKKLISLGVLGARIDLVDHCLFQEDPVKNDSAVVNMISSTYATVRNLETNVRLLEIERSFEIPSFKALEARGQKGGKVR